MPIQVTRALLSAVLDGSLKNASFRLDPYFGFSVRAASALSLQDLEKQVRIRPDRTEAGQRVP
jgi:phosphoenolpyruvate carboxykinase (ATP)